MPEVLCQKTLSGATERSSGQKVAVPQGWKLLSLESVADPRAPIRYGVVQIGPDTPGGVPIVPIKHIDRIGSSNLHRADSIIEQAYAGSRIQAGDVLISVKGTIGRVGVVPDGFEGNIAREIARIRPKSNFCPRFIALQLEADHTQKRITKATVGSTRLEFSIAAVRTFAIPIPEALSEQRRITQILQNWGDAINACERRKQALRRQFEGTRLRLFEAAYASDNQTRHAKDLFEPVSEKGRSDLPLLAVMQDIGVVRRDELDRRVVMPDGDIDGYKVVREGDFVISLRSFEGGLEFSQVTGLVSPAYTVLRTTGGDYVPDYYRHYFKSRSFVGRLDRLIFGIRDGKQIAFRDFGDMKIPNPLRDEQEKAAEILGLLERQMQLAAREIVALKRQKRGLMQKLLTGEWRVKPEGTDG